MSNFQYVKEISAKSSKTWSNIISAESLTQEYLAKIKNAFKDLPASLFSSDVDLTVFGSIARNECTKNSDVDWTIVVDGQTAPEQYEFIQIVKEKLKSTGIKDPGLSGIFGNITFSHDLIHYIGGEDDTNHNLSRRLLILLESDSIFFSESEEYYGGAYDRIIRGIINQYIIHDSGFNSERGKQTKVPRFLLNDFIRFWRTMCVDFAYKQKQQQGNKWALRNIKLRMSRKLIFIKGLLLCFSCYENEKLRIDDIKNHLYELVKLKPIDLAIKILTEANIDLYDICALLDSYDSFLGLLNSDETREHLSNLSMLSIYDDSCFKNARTISDNFQNALNNIFLNKDSKLKEFTLKYGLF